MGIVTTILIQKRILVRFKQLCSQMSIRYTHFLSELITSFLEDPFEIDLLKIERVKFRVRIPQELLIPLKMHANKHHLYVYRIIEESIDNELLNYAILDPKILIDLISLIREINEKNYLLKRKLPSYQCETDDYYNRLLDFEQLLKNEYGINLELLNNTLEKFDRYYENFFVVL